MAIRKFNLEGQSFGLLQATSYHAGKWLCTCACGQSKQVATSDLVAGKTKSCGCLNRSPKMDMRVSAVPGDRYGMLTIISEAPMQKTKRMMQCICECGNTTTTTLNSLRSGNTASCGCLVRNTIGVLKKTHGMSGTRVHRIWRAMLTRCTNPHTTAWPYYGGRGINVCSRWLEFSNFYEDMGEPPNGCSIDRIDNDGPYCADNCRWADSKTQSRNRGRNDQKKQGVNQLRNGKWRANICTDQNKNQHIGVYDTYEAAAAARSAAESVYWRASQSR
jgi:hypothetical protein